MSCTLRGRGIGIACSAAIRVGWRLSTRARSPSAIASVMSWVTKMMVLRPRFHSLSRSACSCGAGLRVDGGERLVHQDHGRIVGERADQRRALAHAAGQLVRIVALEAGEPDGADQHLGMRPGLVVEPALHLDRKQHVVDGGAPRQQVVVLRHVADPPVEAGTQAARIRDLTASPLNTISPALTVSICAIMLSRVDLPAPDGPMMVRNSPGLDREREALDHPRRAARGLAAPESACRGS